MSCWRVFVVLAFVVFVFTSCQTGSGKVRQVAETDSVGYIPPASAPIPAEQLKIYQHKIGEFYQKYLVRSGFNGAILVAKNGQIIFEEYRGYYDIKNKDTLTPRSAFHLASVSKTFTGMAVLKLAQDRKLNISDSVQKFFPDFPYKGITVKTLLNHRSGLPNYMYYMEKLGWPRDTLCTNQDILDYMVEFKPPIAAYPDRAFQYCNTNYSLLALIIEKVSGMSFEEYLRQEFFIPLGMEDTYVFDMDRDSGSAMPSYDHRGRLEPYTFLDLGVGDKNIYSTARDLLKWDQALYTNYLFTDELLQEAFAPYSNERPGVRNYGLGWRMNVYPDGKKVVYHNGWWHGNNTVFIRDVANSVTIIVLGNKYNRNIYQARRIAEAFEDGRVLDAE